MSALDLVLVSGATGLIGRRLVAALLRDGVSVRALSRDPGRSALDARVDTRAWNGRDVPIEAVAGASAVVHLAGEPVFGGLLSAARRRRIRDSRIDSTHSIVSRMHALSRTERPAAFVCASAVGYYGSRGDSVLEESAEPGSGFLAEVCVAWEASAAAAAGPSACSSSNSTPTSASTWSSRVFSRDAGPGWAIASASGCATGCSMPYLSTTPMPRFASATARPPCGPCG